MSRTPSSPRHAGRSDSRRLRGWLGVVAMAVATGSCVAIPVPLRVGINPWPGYEFIYLAQERGFFTRRGLDVRVVEFTSLSDTKRAYGRNQIDIMCTTAIEVLQAREQSSRSPQIVRVVDYSNGADVLLAKPGLTRLQDLKGARIGVELGTVSVYLLARALESAGLGLRDVTLLPFDNSTIEDGFNQGDVQAVVTYPPASVNLLRAGGAHELFSTAGIPGEVVDTIAVEAALAEARPRDIAMFLAAFDDAVAYAGTNPADAYRIMAAREGITPDEFQHTLAQGVLLVGRNDQPAYFAPGGMLTRVLAVTERVLRLTGQLTGPIRSDDVFNRKFLAPPGPS